MKYEMNLLIRNQIYLAIHQVGFWLSTWIIMGYVILTFLYYCISCFGMDVGSTLAASNMYAFQGNAPYWEIFIRILPFVCALNFGYQNTENRKRGTYFYVSLKVNAKEYWMSMTYANLILTFSQIEIASIVSMMLNRLTFQETGVFFEGVKGSETYWKNITGDFAYRWNDFYMLHPWVYTMLYSVIFSLFCMGLAHFLYAVSLYIKENGLWIYVFAAVISLIFYECQYMLGYEIWGDVTVCANASQSGIPTLFIWLIMIVTGCILLRYKILRWEHEE